MVKNPSANAGDIRDMGLIPGSGRSPGGGHGNPLQYSCLENPQGQRRLVGYSPRGRKESDATGAEHNMYFFKPLSSSRHQPQTLPRLPSWDQSR